MGQNVRDWIPSDLPGQWNNGYGNPFLFEDWRPLPDPLEEGEKTHNHVTDTCLLLNASINLSPVLKQQKSTDFFEPKEEPNVEPSQYAA